AVACAGSSAAHRAMSATAMTISACGGKASSATTASSARASSGGGTACSSVPQPATAAQKHAAAATRAARTGSALVIGGSGRRPPLGAAGLELHLDPAGLTSIEVLVRLDGRRDRLALRQHALRIHRAGFDELEQVGNVAA